MEADESSFDLEGACTALLTICIKLMRSVDLARTHLKPIPLGLTSLANEIFALHQVLARVRRLDLQKLGLLETARGQHFLHSFEACFLGCKITISAVNELAEELQQVVPLKIADTAGSLTQPKDELQQFWKEDYLKEFIAQLQGYRDGLIELLIDAQSEYHQGEESSRIDNEDSPVLDLVMSEAPQQMRPSSIRSSDQGSLLDPSPPYALSLHEYLTDHVYRTITQSIKSSGGEESLMLRVSVVNSRDLMRKDKSRSCNLPLVAEICLGPSAQKVFLHKHEETYVDLPLVGIWLLGFFCGHGSGEILGGFELDVESISWNKSVHQLHQQPTWYALESVGWVGDKEEPGFGGAVKLGFTLFDPADKAANPTDLYKKFLKLTDATV